MYVLSFSDTMVFNKRRGLVSVPYTKDQKTSTKDRKTSFLITSHRTKIQLPICYNHYPATTVYY